MRLIDADDAPLFLNTVACEQIKQMPTVDAVPVVRCEQCTWRYMGECMFWAGDGMLIEHNDYCSRGKRRE